jgi:hypothetical protein
MTPTDTSHEQVSTGITLTWDSSFHCIDAPSPGTFALTVSLAYSGDAASAVQINGVRLTHTTPKPFGQSPPATATAAISLPLVLTVGVASELVIGGSYELAPTGNSGRINLHLCLEGQTQSGQTFTAAVNGHIRGANNVAASGVESPILSNIRIMRGPGGVRIAWLTDQPAFSEITIGKRSRMAEAITISSGCTTTQAHSIVVNDLEEDEEYTVQIVARSIDGATAMSEPITFSVAQLETSDTFLPFTKP